MISNGQQAVRRDHARPPHAAFLRCLLGRSSRRIEEVLRAWRVYIPENQVM
ncbi:MAG: hypothetical protein OJF60_001782 [Burkholderiaceae bacterium]|nr:MAG: hypothetical protein OJF60_001782 [Burkholderiaceae bacterium]